MARDRISQRLQIVLAAMLVLLPAVVIGSVWQTDNWMPQAPSVSTRSPLEPDVKRAEIIERAAKWVEENVAYSQILHYDGYRTDCSGFVSMAWQLTSSTGTEFSAYTGNLAQFATKITKDELKAGDILLNENATIYDNRHVVIFHKWANTERTKYWVYEENGSPDYHKAIYHLIDYPYTPGYESNLYQPYRYNALENPGVDSLAGKVFGYHGTDFTVEVRVANRSEVIASYSIKSAESTTASPLLFRMQDPKLAYISKNAALDVSIDGPSIVRSIRHLTWNWVLNYVDFGEVRYGDFNNDNDVNLFDVIRQILMMFESASYSGPEDINRNHRVDIDDVFTTIQTAFGGQPKGDRFSWEGRQPASWLAATAAGTAARSVTAPVWQNVVPVNAIESLEVVKQQHPELAAMTVSPVATIDTNRDRTSKVETPGWMWLNPVEPLEGNPYHVNAGDQFDLALMVNTGAMPVNGVESIVQFDSGVFALNGFTSGQLFDNNYDLPNPADSEIYVSSYPSTDASNITGPGLVGTLHFQALREANASRISIYYRPLLTVDSNIVDKGHDVLGAVYDAVFAITGGEKRPPLTLAIHAPAYVNAWDSDLVTVDLGITDVFTGIRTAELWLLDPESGSNVLLGIDDDELNGWTFDWRVQETVPNDRPVELVAKVPFDGDYVESRAPLIVDTHSPSVTVSVLEQRMDQIALNVSVTDTVSGVDGAALYFNDAADGSAGGTWTMASELLPGNQIVILPTSSLTVGNHLISVVAIDAAGNELELDAPGSHAIVIHVERAPQVIAVATAKDLPNVMAIISKTETISGTIYGAAWSTSGGEYWHELQGLPVSTLSTSTLTSVPLSSIAIVVREDQSQPIRILLGTAASLYRTGDFGMSWAKIPVDGGPASQYDSCWHDLLSTPADSELLYIVSHCSHTDNSTPPTISVAYTLYYSLDAGITWSLASSSEGYGQFTPSPVVPGLLYGSSGQFSTDYGKSFSDRDTLNGLTLTAPDREDANTLYGVRYINRIGWMGAVSLDAGATWDLWANQPCSNFVTVSLISTGRHELWAACGPGYIPLRNIYYSSDAGTSWRFVTDWTPDTVLASDFAHPGRGLFGRAHGLWASMHGGEWQLLTDNFVDYPNRAFLPSIRR